MGFKDPALQREYQRKWIAKRRAEFFEGKVCVRCGSSDRLELDHIDRRQKIHHAVWSWSKGRREAEISKCQVLCHDCHLQKTSGDRASVIRHGTDAMYRRKCKCLECKAYKKERNARRYRSHAGMV